MIQTRVVNKLPNFKHNEINICDVGQIGNQHSFPKDWNVCGGMPYGIHLDIWGLTQMKTCSFVKDQS